MVRLMNERVRVRDVTWRMIAAGIGAVGVLLTVGCTNGPAVLTRQVEARSLASAMHLAFTKANEAANRAVMADTDETSIAAAREAEQTTARVTQDLQQLQPLLASLGYQDEISSLEGFGQRFAEFRKLDAEILPLAIENTNLKAQRLSIVEGRQAVDAFAAAVRAAVKMMPASREAASDSETSRAALLEIQVLQARHIAEADEEAMSRMEAQMKELESVARAGIGRLRTVLPAAARESLSDADAAFGRFTSVNREIVELSRRNTNVRSLALTLGRKRVVAVECEDQLRMLEETLGKHAFQATR